MQNEPEDSAISVFKAWAIGHNLPRAATFPFMKILHVLDHSLPRYDGYAFRSWEIIRLPRLSGIETAQLMSSKHEGEFV